MFCDSKTNYMINAMPYVGKTNMNGEFFRTFCLKTLTETLWDSKRHVTMMDNWFTSVPLANNLFRERFQQSCSRSRKDQQVSPSFVMTNNARWFHTNLRKIKTFHRFLRRMIKAQQLLFANLIKRNFIMLRKVQWTHLLKCVEV